jgi:hypothetical protein
LLFQYFLYFIGDFSRNRGTAIIEEQIGKVNISRQARHSPEDHIDCPVPFSSISSANSLLNDYSLLYGV